MKLEGKVAIVAGGTGGLGRSVSLALLEAGARVIAPYRDANEFAALRQAAGRDAALAGEAVDVTDPGATTVLVRRTVEEHGQLDILVNTVGGYAGGVKAWETPSDLLEKLLALNLRSGYTLAGAAMPAMLARKSGCIVNVAAKAAFDHAAGAAAYAASKAAAVAFMDSLAEDARGSGVRINTILPSIIDTAANRQAMPKADYSKWPKPEDIARVIVFLCTDEARVIHGAAIPVYGSL